MAEGGNLVKSSSNESMERKLKGYERLNKKNEDGNTPLHIAASKGNNDIIKMLLKLGVSAEEPNNNGETALHMAVESGSEKAVRSLLAAGANLSSETGDGRSVWHIAASTGNSKILKLLAESTVQDKLVEDKSLIEHENSKLSSCDDSISSREETEISLNVPEGGTNLSLIKSNSSSKVEQSSGNEIKCSPEVDLENRSEVKANDASGTEIREKPNAKSLDGNGGLIKTNKESKTKQARLEPNFSKMVPSEHRSASSFRGISPQAMLEREFFDFDDEENIREAFFINPIELIHELLSGPRGRAIGREEARKHFNNLSTRNVDLNKRDHNGFTALHMAAAVGAEDAVFRFLKKKPDVNIRTSNGATPLIMAATGGSVKIIKMLLKAGANYNLTDKNGITPLHVAALNNNTSAVNVFLSLGLDPNSEDNEGNTPLHFTASRPGNIGPALALLKAKANANQANKDGLTPSFMAAIRGDFGFLRLLASYTN